MTADAASRLRMLSRDWDRINYARQKERERSEAVRSQDGAAEPCNSPGRNKTQPQEDKP